MIQIGGAVALVLALMGGAYWLGFEAGQDDIKAEKVPALLDTLDRADKQAGKLQTTLDALGEQGSAVQANIKAANVAADEAAKRLADAGVMADCGPFTERDVRVLNREIDRLQSGAGVAGR